MNIAIVSMAVVLIFGTQFVFAQDNEKTKKSTEEELKYSDLREEQRKIMAEKHEQMANCLRSGKLVQECRRELMGMDQQMMWDEECPMMDMMNGRAIMKDKKVYKEKSSAKKEENSSNKK